MRAALLLLLLGLSAGSLLPVAPAPVPEPSFAPPAVLAFQGARRVKPEGPLVDQVRQSINDAITFLQNQQRKTDGSWEAGGGAVAYPGGWTSLALLALLNAGVDPKDPSIQRGLAYLRKIPPDRTYVVGLQTMVYCLAGEKADKERIQRNVNWLLSARLPTGWSYTSGARAGIADNSNSQYALLGLHEALLAGARVDRKALRQIQTFYRQTQTKSGGWGYRPGLEPTPTMTTAGLCNLIITGMDLAIGKAVLRPDGSAENCGVYAENRPVNKALLWLGDRFPARLSQENAADRLVHPFYCLYGIERAGRLTGQRFLGGHDWYEVGCRFLVETQKADGSWRGEGGRAAFDHQPVVATSFALLFLSKGRTPVLISKLAFGGSDYLGWNNKRNDMRHLVGFASRELFKNKPLAWQVFDARSWLDSRAAHRRALADLRQAPVVFFNGHDQVPSGALRDLLRDYLAGGGFVLAENCCGKERPARFDRDLRTLVADVLPGATLAPLPATHPIWKVASRYGVTPRDFPLEGVQKGGRTVLVYSPAALAGYWEANQFDRGQGQKAFHLGASILAVATGGKAPPPRCTGVAGTRRGR
jgi:hypothetical protein